MKPFLDDINNQIFIGDIVLYVDGGSKRVCFVNDGWFDLDSYHISLIDKHNIPTKISSVDEKFRSLYVITNQYACNNDMTWVNTLASVLVNSSPHFRDMTPTSAGIIIEPVVRWVEKYENEKFKTVVRYGYNNGKYSKYLEPVLLNGKNTLSLKGNVTINGSKLLVFLDVNSPFPKPTDSRSLNEWTTGKSMTAAKLTVGHARMVITSEGNVVSDGRFCIDKDDPLTHKDIVEPIRKMIQRCENS